MNGHMKSHGKHMLLGGAGVVVLMMAFGVGWQQAVTWGVLLACPLGMFVMMRFMGQRESGGHQHGDQESHDHGSYPEYRSGVPRQRLSETFPPERWPGAR